ncbi:MAG: MoaD/ThiS family protein [Flavisolibacter sp.]
MKIEIIAFGIAKEIFEGDKITVELNDGATIADLKSRLEDKYNDLKTLSSYMIAMDSEYASNGMKIIQGKEIAIIPPVSGG